MTLWQNTKNCINQWKTFFTSSESLLGSSAAVCLLKALPSISNRCILYPICHRQLWVAEILKAVSHQIKLQWSVLLYRCGTNHQLTNFSSSVMKKNIFAVISSVSICLVFRSLITINNNNHFSRGNSFILTLKLESVATYTWRYLLLITSQTILRGSPHSHFFCLSHSHLFLFSRSLFRLPFLSPVPASSSSSTLCSHLSDPQLCQDFSSPLNAPLLIL